MAIKKTEIRGDMDVSQYKNYIDDRVYLERVKQFFGNAAGNMVASLVGAFLVGTVMKGAGVSFETITIWFGIIFVLTGVVAGIEYRFSKITLGIETAKKWVLVRIASGSTIGIMYGVSPFLFPQNVDIGQEMFLFIVLSTMVSIASTGYSIMPCYYISLNFVTMAPLTIFFATRQDMMHIILVISAVSWQLFVVSKAWKVSKSSINAIYLNERLRDEIDEHERTREQLLHMATHDGLTGLLNRNLLFDRLENAISWARRSNMGFAVMFLDLDGFKAINDVHGHDAGDAILCTIAARLTDQARDTDIVARFGGDEFVIVYTNISSANDGVTLLAERLTTTLAEAIPLPDGHLGQVGASIGIALFPDKGSDPETLLKAADEAMYRAKEDGKNRFVYA
jgi:diguanylate cyclase (GGDEF)-like protein